MKASNFYISPWAVVQTDSRIAIQAASIGKHYLVLQIAITHQGNHVYCYLFPSQAYRCQFAIRICPLDLVCTCTRRDLIDVLQAAQAHFIGAQVYSHPVRELNGAAFLGSKARYVKCADPKPVPITRIAAQMMVLVAKTKLVLLETPRYVCHLPVLRRTPSS